MNRGDGYVVGGVEIPRGIVPEVAGKYVGRVVAKDTMGVPGVTFEFRKPGARTRLAEMIGRPVWDRVTLGKSDLGRLSFEKPDDYASAMHCLELQAS